MLNEDSIRTALGQVAYPGFSRDIISFGLVKEITVSGADVVVKLSVATRDPDIPRRIHTDCTRVLGELPGIGKIDLDFEIQEPPAAGADASSAQSSIPGVKKIIAVGSGKGGVGKSTVSSNLAVALAASGASVGLCDCDLYGPSIAMMFGTDARPNATEENEIIPIEAHGIKLMSMGFLLEDSSPVIVRGPMATRYTQQFLRQVVWGELDYLILDLPPGTGDIQLTIVQTVALDGALIVTTPQEVAVMDARKAAAMFEKVNVPILGIIENMSGFVAPDTGTRYPIFGEGGGRREAERLNVPLLGEIPLEMPTREAGDQGSPIALAPPTESQASASFHEIAGKLATTLQQ